MRSNQMRSNQKGFINITFIIVVIMLMGVVGYLTLIKKSPAPSSQTQPVNTLSATAPQPALKAVNWENLLPSMQIALKQAFPDIQVEESRSINIYRKIDITGDGVPEALVNLGTGGATTDFVALIKIENNKPIVPLFKQQDEKISTLMFTNGAGGAGRYGSTTEMLANENAIYSASYSKYGESADYCRAETYQWDPQTKIFEYNAGLSDKIQQDYCRATGMGF